MVEHVTAQAVAEFVERIAAMYVDEPVTVEPVPVVPACPWRACVVWEGRRWHILADSQEEPLEVLRLCFHELYHVKERHITPATAKGRPSVAERRAMARGYTSALQRAEANMSAARAAPNHVPDENDANAWAYHEAAGWWPTLRDWQNPAKAAAVAWNTHRRLTTKR